MKTELAIRGGTVVDGTGSPGVRADLGIAGGRIVEIAEKVTAPREIDASGRIVAPGFVDLPTHDAPQVLWDRDLTPSSWQGVTSVVAGNCGYSIAPSRGEGRGSLLRTLDKVEDMRLSTLEAGVTWDFETYGEYLHGIEKRGTAINFGGYVGHTPVRIYVLGDEAYEREATEVEIHRICEVVAESVRGLRTRGHRSRNRAHVRGRGRVDSRRRPRLLDGPRGLPHR